jgi:hypothetical protein
VRKLRYLLLPVLLLLASACGPHEVLFPADLEPLEPNEAPMPADPAGGRPPEVVNVLTVSTAGDFDSVHARGVIHQPIAKVLAALEEADPVVDRRRVTEWSVARDVLEDAESSFKVRNVVQDLVTVEFDSVWRLGTVDGEPDEPVVVAARGSVSGTRFITLIEDSVVLRRLDERTTLVESVRQIRSFNVGAPEAELYLRDAWESLKARAHGRPLPLWE